MPVTTRSQSRLARLFDDLFAEGAFGDSPALVAPLIDRQPEPSVLLDLPAVSVLRRRWIVERFIFGSDLQPGSFRLGAQASVSIGQTLELKLSKRFRRGALVVEPKDLV